MTNAQNNHLRMFRAVRRFFIENAEALLVLAALNVIKVKLETLISEIEKIIGIQEENISGYTDVKEQLHTELIEECKKVNAGILSWAVKNENVQLRKKFYKSISQYTKLKESDLIVFCNSVIAQAGEVISSLEEFNVTAAMLTALTNKKTAYYEAMDIPRSKRSTRKAQTKDLVRLFRSTNSLLNDEADIMMMNFEYSNPTLYQEYLNQRTIEDKGKKRKSADIKADPNTGTNNTNTGTNNSSTGTTEVTQ